MFSTNLLRLVEELIELPTHPKNRAKDFKLNFNDEIINGMAVKLN